MQEGLVLLDEKGTVLSINHAACRLFQADNGCVGRDFLTVDRSHELCLAMETAREKGHSQLRCQRNGREYQLDMSRIQSDGETVGTVLLAFDVTEQEYAERNRREFTANVSPRTEDPLQGIVGSAELIQSGMVKPEDMPRFVGHIHDEASRMVTLVEDIIRLSQLDEGDAMPTETVDLLALSQEAVANLQDAAAKQQVSLSVDGDHAPVIGVRRLLYEVIFNLCDNAIKYNVPDGTVKVQVSSENGISSVTVSDTGIGIAPEHQSRVFERFYRVDKSHSKASGGTGLGRRGGRPLRDGAAARHGRAAGPGPQRPPGRELRHLPQGYPHLFQPGGGTGCAWPSSGSWSPWAGRWWSSRSWCSPSLPAPPPCPFWPPRALCCSWVCRRRSCRRGSASRREACKTAPEPSGSGAVFMSLHLILTALAPEWLQTGLPCNRRRAAPGPPPPTGAGWWRSRWRT
mgnify:CR=1 FL=1